MKKAIDASVLLMILILVLTVVINSSHSESRIAYNMNNLMGYNTFIATYHQATPLQETDKRDVFFRYKGDPFIKYRNYSENRFINF